MPHTNKRTKPNRRAAARHNKKSNNNPDIYTFDGFAPSSAGVKNPPPKNPMAAKVSSTYMLLKPHTQEEECIWVDEVPGLKWELDQVPITTRTLLYTGEDLDGASLFIDVPLG